MKKERYKHYMKTTGIYRRIDNLGRIVIPKKIRKALGIKEGDSIEIFVNRNAIILRRYDVTIGLVELVRRLNNEFYDIKNDMEEEIANKISKHIYALQEILKGTDIC